MSGWEFFQINNMRGVGGGGGVYSGPESSRNLASLLWDVLYPRCKMYDEKNHSQVNVFVGVIAWNIDRGNFQVIIKNCSQGCLIFLGW